MLMDDVALIEDSPSPYHGADEDKEAEMEEKKAPVTSSSPSSLKCTPRRKIIIATIIGLFVIVTILVSVLPRQSSHPSSSSSGPLNIIMLIPDGTGPASFTLARQLRENKRLHMDSILTGTVQTESYDSLTTDSAAGATAMACGVKTYNGAIGVNGTGHPVGTVLEAAKERGMRVGVIVTSSITHATPASFTAHVANRNSECDIAVQQYNLGLDFGFGGGYRFYNSTFCNNSRNLWSDLSRHGYTTMLSRSEFDTWNKKPTFPAYGLFADMYLPYEIDRDPTVTPSLAEMVAAVLKGLEETATSGPGFFLMIEGSRVDMAGHNNDVAAHVHELLAFDDAAGEVLAFITKHPNTLVLSSADHETGGLSLGVENVPDYDPSLIPYITRSSEAIAQMLMGNASINETLRTYAHMNVTDQEYQIITTLIQNHANKTLYANPLTDYIGRISSERMGFGWATTHHTGIDVNLYASGPSEWVARLVGNHQNTDLAQVMADYLSLDLGSVTRRLNGNT